MCVTPRLTLLGQFPGGYAGAEGENAPPHLEEDLVRLVLAEQLDGVANTLQKEARYAAAAKPNRPTIRLRSFCQHTATLPEAVHEQQQVVVPTVVGVKGSWPVSRSFREAPSGRGTEKKTGHQARAAEQACAPRRGVDREIGSVKPTTACSTSVLYSVPFRPKPFCGLRCCCCAPPSLSSL